MGRLTIGGLHKFYGSTHAVRGVDLDIPEGEFAVLVGPSGCGKSTLLRAIAGLEPVDRGTIEIDGEVINEVRPRDRNVAIVFQNYALYPYMNVHENIAFDLRARRFRQGRDRAPGVPGGGDAGHCATARAPAAPAVGGQRQRAAIGRAIVRDARLFLFDEPLCNLDVKLRDEMRSEIKRLQTQLGNTMVYVTHDQVEAMTLADRIVLLKDGLIEQEGAPLDLFERPRTRFVAGFLGSPSMNFVPATLAGGNGRVEVRKRAGLAPLQVTVDLIQRPARAPPRPSASPAPRWWPSSRPTTSSARASSSRCRPA